MEIQSVKSTMVCGGQFERLIGLIKQTLYQTIGKAHLKSEELEELFLVIEVNLNNRPITSKTK